MVSDPDVIGDQRFLLVCVVPITGTPGEGLPYPHLAPGRSGLAKQPFAPIDQLRSIDKRRIRRVFGELAREEIAAIDEGLAVFLGVLELEGFGFGGGFAALTSFTRTKVPCVIRANF